jgi:hypothetical protein
VLPWLGLIRYDRGNPWVKFVIPLPIPSYTIPLQGMGMGTPMKIIGIKETHSFTQHCDKTTGFCIDQSIYYKEAGTKSYKS